MASWWFILLRFNSSLHQTAFPARLLFATGEVLIVSLSFLAAIAATKPFGVGVLIAFKEADYFQTAKATAFEVLGRVCHLSDTYGNLRGWQEENRGATPNAARRRAGCSPDSIARRGFDRRDADTHVFRVSQSS